MTIEEIRQRYKDFFRARGHAVIPSASLVPENDPSVLFTTAGMQPLVPYLLGERHPAGTRLVNAQKCVRTGDIDDVGDNRHLTFFEMLGNWSLGDYFKRESIRWSFEFLTSPTEGLGLDPARLYVTVFRGEAGVPRDDEAIRIWQEVFTAAHLSAGVGPELGGDVRIIPLGSDDNFWIAGATGPCGGDTEIFYDTAPEQGSLSGSFANTVSSFRLIEVWNNVFMEFTKDAAGTITPLAAKNVDTGMGLERTAAVVQGVSSVFETDAFTGILNAIAAVTTVTNERARRIIADHLRTVVFMVADGVLPSNTDRGYVVRRLLRRAVRYADLLEIPAGHLATIAAAIKEKYSTEYPDISREWERIKEVIATEETKFRETLQRGLREFEKINGTPISGVDAFRLFSSYGFPFELTKELAGDRGVDEDAFQRELQTHQDISRAGAEQKFKGGLGGTSEQIVKYHTATHLLHQALADVLGPEVAQRGSNITEERLRFDFSFPRKLTEEEKKRVEAIVNEKIAADLPVHRAILPRAEAEATGARHLFSEKYGDQISLYFIGENLETAYSKEFCGGPHVDHTGQLGTFTIQKEEAVAAGIRRIKAVLK